MRSERAKVLHELGGEPMLLRAMRAVASSSRRRRSSSSSVIRRARSRPLVRAARRRAHKFGVRASAEQRGTGHAARCGMTAVPRDFAGDILITYGDLPMLSPATLAAFRAAHRECRAALSFITVLAR